MRLRARVLVVLALALAACASSPTDSQTTTTVPKPLLALVAPITAAVATPRAGLPVVDTTATPKGWVPVDYGDAQISVPASFSVVYRGQYPCDVQTQVGTLFVGSSPNTACLTSPRNANTTVVYLRLQRFPSEYLHLEDSVVRNALRLYGLELNGVFGYYSPFLGAVVASAGPLAQQVINTITASPRAFALAEGPTPKISRSWRTITFAGIKLAAPSGWTVSRATRTMGLGDICRAPTALAFFSTQVTLSSDAQKLLIPLCPRSGDSPQPPANGVQIDSGLQTEPLVSLSFSRCWSVQGLTVCPASSPAYSILVLKVTVPGRSKPVYLSIGLAGNGMIARTIQYSLRAA